MSETPSDSNPKETPAPQKKMPVWAIAFYLFMQLIFMKFTIMWFGALYSDQPGMGYGYALSGSIILSIIMVGRFYWKYRDYDF